MNIGYCETQKTINTDFSLSVHLHAYYSTTKFNGCKNTKQLQWQKKKIQCKLSFNFVVFFNEIKLKVL